ncbi:MAG TPA: hypothetical protein VGA49_03615 [Patescibacteria group bacterium]
MPNKNHLHRLEEKAEKKTQKRAKKDKPKMKVSGKSVLKLKEIIGKAQGTRHEVPPLASGGTRHKARQKGTGNSCA